MVVEAAFERMDVKKPIFEKLDQVMKPALPVLEHVRAGHG